MGMEIYLLWGVRFGILLILLGIFLPSKNRKTILSKVVNRRTVNYAQNTTKIARYLDKVTENPSLRSFMLKEDSDDFAKIDDMILQAGGLGGITPNVIQLIKLLLPPVLFVVSLAVYLIRVTTTTVSLNPTQLQAILDKSNSLGGFVQAQVSQTAQATSGGINPIAILWIFMACIVTYFIPEFLIKQQIKARRKTMQKELPIMETFIVIMLESGNHTAYDILKTLLDTTSFFKPYLTMCLNEYYVDPKRAIQNMADRIMDEEFQILCNSLKQAVDMDKRYTVTFMKQHLDQIKKIQDLQREAAIKKKPLLYVFLLALPLIDIVIIWFYPWFVNAMKMLSTGF